MVIIILVLAVKSVKQAYKPSEEIIFLLNAFRQMVNDCIRIGLASNISTLKRLSNLSYKELLQYDVPSYYKLCAISKAAGILANRKKSIKRGIRTRTPYMQKGCLVSCYGFKIADGLLKIPLGDREYFNIQLNAYTQKVLSVPALRVRSFTLTANTMSICYSKQVAEIECTKTAGIDRNLRNVTYGNCNRVIDYSISRAVEIAENTKQIVASFKRNDVRIRKQLSNKYGNRRKNRVQQILHKVSKHIVQEAATNKEAIVFEKLTGLRKLYRRGNGQGRKYRHTMNNSFPFYELERDTIYKAQWKGVPVIHVCPYGSSLRCPRCGKRTQVALKNDLLHHRQVWCNECKRWMDRDVVAAMNLSANPSIKGGEVFHRSKGLAGEAMRGNVEVPILRVDASKLTFHQRKGEIGSHPIS